MRSVPSAVVAAVAVLVFTSCQPDVGPVIPDPVPTSELLFESEEEALAAAEEAYGAYLAMLDQIRAEGGVDEDRLELVATGEVLTHEQDALREFQTRGHHTVGSLSFDSVELQQYEPRAQDGLGVLYFYACEDFSAVDVLDQSGASVLVPGRQLRWPLVVGFDWVESTLLVSSTEDWTGANFCDL